MQPKTPVPDSSSATPGPGSTGDRPLGAGRSSGGPSLEPVAERAARRQERAAQVIRQEAKAVAGLEHHLSGEFDRAVEAILGCRSVVVTGMGKAGLVGNKISATLASTGTPSFGLHPGEALHGDLGRIRPEDLVLCLSNSGETAEVRALVPGVKRIGASIVAMTESADSSLARLSDIVLELGPVPEACPLGLAPTASTSAMLALGDALAMVVLEERGFGREDYARFHPAGSLGRKLMRVAEIMRQGDELPLVPEDADLDTVLDVMGNTPGRPGAAVLVSPGGTLAGIFTDGDLRRLLRQHAGPSEDVRVLDHAARSPRSIGADQLVEEAIRALKTAPAVDQLIVVDDKRRPIGLLDVQDVLDLKL